MGRNKEKDKEKDKSENKDSKFKMMLYFLFCKNLIKTLTGMVVLAALIIVLTTILKKDEPVKEVITVSTLEKIIEVSDLSTFRVVYNGVALADDKYYVSYEATVDAGIDFEKIEILVDNDNKEVTVKLPKAEILDIYVDIASLDFIFIDKKANTETVSEQAYKLCKFDVRSESSNQEEIIDLAQQNAENVIIALVKPFVDQVDPEYVITVE